MTKSGPLGFLFSSRRRSNPVSTATQAPISDDQLLDPLIREGLGANLPDQILSETAASGRTAFTYEKPNAAAKVLAPNSPVGKQPLDDNASNESPSTLTGPTLNVVRAVSERVADISADLPGWWENSVRELSVSGYVEILTSEFVSGWAQATSPDHHTHVLALLDGAVIGASIANLKRADLDRARAESALDAYAFAIVFNNPIPADRAGDVIVVSPMARLPLARARSLKVDLAAPTRIFLFGSPRSGTSEMGTTLTKVLNLPWVGEGHAAPLFSAAAQALQGDASAASGLVRFMGTQNYRNIAVNAAKQAYFFCHGAASFVDKTPGAPMIAAGDFIYECFPDAYFIFLWRNPVANVASRLAKFGGDFEGHCRDWAASMETWSKLKPRLPHFLEVRQEEMLSSPDRVGTAISQYIGRPETAAAIGKSLSGGSRERTGAGIGKEVITDTDWTSAQISAFSRICDPIAKAFSEG